LWVKEQRKFYAFSLDNGEHLWTTDSEIYLDAYGWGNMEHEWLFTDKYLYSTGVGGIIYCRSLETGKTVWTYKANDPYQEYLFTNNWWQRILFISDGKLYTAHAEHSSLNPLPRGAPMLCLDLETGDEIWRADGLLRTTHWGGRAIIGDSIIAMMDTYSQMVVAIGKGPSKITVSIKDNVVPLGSSVLIDGTVMDVSPGTESSDLKLRFPNGVPAVSDDSMVDWMKYVYKQFECPADVEGVDVFLKILDPNGEWYSVTVTSDRNGVFSHMWAPSVVGEYHVTAAFEGSKSYYPSQATTTFGVDQAPAAYPDVPTAEEIAQTTVNRLPAYPDVPTASEVAQETVNHMPAYPEMPDIPEIPSYLTIDLVIIATVAIAIIIGIVSYLALRKQK